MTRRDDPNTFYGPPLPLDDRIVPLPGVVFAAEGQPRDSQGRYRDTSAPYRGEDLTPAYRRHLLGLSPIGRQILKTEDEAAAQGR